jgi:hypothetical protein
MISPAEMEIYKEENALLKKQIEERTGKTVEQLYSERAKRVRDAIELRVPDRGTRGLDEFSTRDFDIHLSRF